MNVENSSVPFWKSLRASNPLGAVCAGARSCCWRRYVGCLGDSVLMGQRVHVERKASHHRHLAAVFRRDLWEGEQTPTAHLEVWQPRFPSLGQKQQELNKISRLILR